MSLEKPGKNDVALIGILSDANSSFKRGAASAPPLIRRAMHSGSANLCSELGPDLVGNPRFVDVGDRQVGDDPQSFLAIESEIQSILEYGAMPLVLGGDHAISYPVLRAIHRAHGAVNILHFDAHPDLYDDFEGNPLSHASPFARIMENGLASRLVQVGIRTLSGHLRAQVERFGVEVHEMRTLQLDSIGRDFEGPVYISCRPRCPGPRVCPRRLAP